MTVPDKLAVRPLKNRRAVRGGFILYYRCSFGAAQANPDCQDKTLQSNRPQGDDEDAKLQRIDIATIRKRKRPLSDLERGCRMPRLKYEERRAGVCACLCISIVHMKLLTFRLTIALQRFVLSIGIGLRRPERTVIV